MSLYSQVQAAAGMLRHARGLYLVAGPKYQLPPTDHMLPPFISIAANRWDLPKETRDVMVQQELDSYNADMERRIAEDPVAVFGLRFSRDSIPALHGTLGFKEDELAVVNADGDIKLVDYREMNRR